MKKLLLAAALGLGLATQAFAAVDLSTGPYDFDAKKFTNNPFTDTYEFTAGEAGGQVSFSLIEVKLANHVDIDWDDSAAFSIIGDDGSVLFQAGETTPIHYTFGDSFSVPASFSIVLKGAAIGNGMSPWNEGLKGSYSLSVIANPVPEPETYALMVAGLGVVGYMSRRRRQR
ncbi:FxDxF family PEP-CTERM protein [Aquabacterium sp. A7-Y]|uniref:FxDxF family PEP-CTERM protein n=1 Tax=Aquabacterium sp. A7-Y TaxID=1349605 RepID=UPI00223E26B9|nr:FxDxF family PEP-CTERM protein [Aquabacterium sp. A7-Y]MCW7539307.1 FxDxF family PEP-CTERM protein [Aquabacterium sp. A7-Y]